MSTFTRQTLPNPAIVVAVIFGLVLAVFLGVSAGAEDLKTVAVFLGMVVATVIVLWLRTSIWILIPMFWPLTGKISALPLPFSVRDLAVIMAGGMFLIYYALKLVRGKPIYNWLDVILGVNLAYLFVTYLRNPVGVAAFGSENVGGRPYFNILIACMAYAVLHRVTVTPKKAHLIPAMMLAASTTVAFLGVLTQYVPALVPVIAPFYNGIVVSGYMAEQSGRGAEAVVVGTTRIDSLGTLGLALTGYILARWNPSTIISPIYPHRFALGLIAFACIMLSGFRSMALQIMGFFLIACYLHGRWDNVVRNSILGLAALVLVVTSQGNLVQWPMTMQRALSWLPGQWNPRAIQAAKNSNEWRIEMWRVALTTDRYIKDKIWGDGFGFTMRNLKIMLAQDSGGVGFLGVDTTKENFMIQGSFHSGPVSAIRFVGVVGLVLYLVLFGAVAFYAYRLWYTSEGTPYAFAGRFFAIGSIYEPFHYVFVAGSYDNSMPSTIFTLAVLKMFDLSLTRYQKEQNAPRVEPRFSPQHPWKVFSPAQLPARVVGK